jgi:hypothetical protein
VEYVLLLPPTPVILSFWKLHSIMHAAIVLNPLSTWCLQGFHRVLWEGKASAIRHRRHRRSITVMSKVPAVVGTELLAVRAL